MDKALLFEGVVGLLVTFSAVGTWLTRRQTKPSNGTTLASTIERIAAELGQVTDYHHAREHIADNRHTATLGIIGVLADPALDGTTRHDTVMELIERHNVSERLFRRYLNEKGMSLRSSDES